ncbi:MAG: hypothetical protein ACOC3F_04090, partial [Desulfosudaceae bacterium]
YVRTILQELAGEETSFERLRPKEHALRERFGTDGVPPPRWMVSTCGRRPPAARRISFSRADVKGARREESVTE